MRLLVIEDNLDFQKFLKLRLEEKCFAVDAASDGDRGLSLARMNDYDLILLDYSLPRKNGYEICEEIRALGKHMPIIMISGTGDIPHKVDGFNLGIDDYLVKPFFFEELVARIQAALRRPPVQASMLLSIDDLVVDTRKQQVMRGQASIYLTRKEYALAEYLLKNARSVVSRGEIMEHVWDRDIDLFSNTIETHILNLRKKIDLPRKRKLIHSVPGRGYKFDLER